MTDHKLNILDSLPDDTQGGQDPEVRHEKIRLQVCGALNLTMETAFDMSENDFRTWKYEFPKVPWQDNSDDCGFFVFKFMRLWDGHQFFQSIPTESRQLRMDFLAYILSYKDNKAELPPLVSRWIKKISEETIIARKGRQSWSSHVMNTKLLNAAREGDVKKFDELLEGEGGSPIPPTRTSSVLNSSRDEPSDVITSNQHGVTRPKLDDAVAIERAIDIPEHSSAEDADEVPATNQAEIAREATYTVRLLRSILEGATAEGDGVLHIAARFGHEEFVRNVCCKAELILEHTCAAVSDFEEVERTQAVWFGEFLRARNHRGETCLHEAVRWGSKEIVLLLVEADAKLNDSTSDALVQIVNDEEASPLYLATTLRKADIIKILTDEQSTIYSPSYTGPGGKTALHAAVLLDKVLSKELLEWKKDLINMPDVFGSTPLHYLASNGGSDIARLLLEKNSESAYWADSNGSLPSHVAAANGRVDIIQQLLKVCADCLWLLNDSGQSILHIAVEKKKEKAVKYICGEQNFTRILNLRDMAGNSAIHSAVRTGNQWIFFSLIRNKEVKLSLVDKEEHTPLDLAVLSLPAGLKHVQAPRSWILYDLVLAGADLGTCRWDHLKSKKEEADRGHLSKAISKSAGLLAVCSVLILNIAFAAAFNVANSYNSFSHERTARRQSINTRRSRARKHAFKAFVLSDSLAFLFSSVTTFCCTFAGFSTMDKRTRSGYLVMGFRFLRYSAVSMIAVFMLGLYVVVEPVDVRIATVACVFALVAVSVLFMTPVVTMLLHMWFLSRRLGFRAWWYNVLCNRRHRHRVPFQFHPLAQLSLSVLGSFLVVCVTITGFSYL
uniref:PGG domain-containing protein n=1 Tax=Leersia perrieri TaxID=77586 RepID=A0A0D9W2K1_9ORYZ